MFQLRTSGSEGRCIFIGGLRGFKAFLGGRAGKFNGTVASFGYKLPKLDTAGGGGRVASVEKKDEGARKHFTMRQRKLSLLQTLIPNAAGEK